MKFFIIAILSGLINFSAIAQHGNHESRNETTRKAWIDSVLVNFDSKSLNENIKTIKLDHRQLGDVPLLSIRVKGEGIFNVNDKEWIYFLSNSNHKNPGVGDITIAINQKGKAWYNHGHVCGGIIHFATKQISELKHSKEFFKYFVSDTDYEVWERY